MIFTVICSLLTCCINHLLVSVEANHQNYLGYLLEDPHQTPPALFASLATVTNGRGGAVSSTSSSPSGNGGGGTYQHLNLQHNQYLPASSVRDTQHPTYSFLWPPPTASTTTSMSPTQQLSHQVHWPRNQQHQLHQHNNIINNNNNLYHHHPATTISTTQTRQQRFDSGRQPLVDNFNSNNFNFNNDLQLHHENVHELQPSSAPLKLSSLIMNAPSSNNQFLPSSYHPHPQHHNIHHHNHHQPMSTSTSKQQRLYSNSGGGGGGGGYGGHNTNSNNNYFNGSLDEHIGFGDKHSGNHVPIMTPNINNNNHLDSSSERQLAAGGGLARSQSLSNSKVPLSSSAADPDREIIASNNGPRCDKFTPEICVDDFEYPEQAIIDEINKKRDVFALMYSEVKDNEPLVDGIPRDVEESYNYEHFTSSNSAGGGDNSYASSARSSSLTPASSQSALVGSRNIYSNEAAAAAATSAASSVVDGMDALIGAITPHASQAQPTNQSPPTSGFICPSEVMYGKPKLAKNKKGQWKVIVNAGEFTQTVRLEKCLMPNKRCNYVSAQSYESRCAQVHSYHRLLVFEKGRGFYIDTFRLPTGCNCHVTKRPSAQSTVHRAIQAAVSGGTSRSPPQQQLASDSDANNGGGNGSSDEQEDSGENGGTNSLENNDQPRQSQHQQQQQQVTNIPKYSAQSALPGTRLINNHHQNSNTNTNNNGHSSGTTSNSNGNGSQRNVAESMLSQTLWSILGGDKSLVQQQLQQPLHTHSLPLFPHNQQQQQQQHSSHAYQPAAATAAAAPNHYQAPLSHSNQQQQQPAQQHSQSAILEHLSANPNLAANISESVLRQLMSPMFLT